MLFDFLFPNRCLHCMVIIPASELVCLTCYNQVDFTHFDYNTNNTLLQKCRLLFPTEHAYALMHFDKKGLSQKILHQLKYGHREMVGQVLSHWTIERLNFEEHSKPDLITTVPLHSTKQKVRGYNQLHRFANFLSKKWEIPVDHSLLERIDSGKSQASKNRSERHESKHSFTLTKEIHSKHILIVDDVFTTGNTMSNIAWEILQEPTNKVSILVMAMD